MFKPSMAELGLCMYQVVIVIIIIIVIIIVIIIIIVNILFHTTITITIIIMVFIAVGHPGTGAHSRPLRPFSVPSNAFKC